MSFKKLIAPNIAILIVLSLFWFAGVDTVVRVDPVDSILQYEDDDHRTNLYKYVETQKAILDNYVEQVDLTELYKSSIRGLIKNVKDSTLDVSGTPADTSFSENLSLANLTESANRFEEAYLFIANNYPEENMDRRTEDAIRSMFNSLDPHSLYIEAEDSEVIEEEFAGKFQGVGIQFNVIQDTITVITAISGGPSDQLGIMSGDRIIGIGDSSAIGFNNDEVRNSLRGPKGSKVSVTIKRPRVNNLLNFNITRDDIPLYTVDTSYMLDERTGYIKINRFAATTHEEFMEAMNDLEEKGMDRIILDLRNNPGGYMNQAIAIAEEFFPRGTKLVSTKSRHSRFSSSYLSRKTGKYTDEPVIVLMNEGSASASEIVSGALQDHDRGLIVGRRSFGKGLVQQQFQLIDSSNIRVTISRYYTPSGRLIQKPYSQGREEYVYEIHERRADARGDAIEFIKEVPDSLRYFTDGGRTVYGGGGIVPDHIVQEDTARSAAVYNYMLREQIGFDFVRRYLDENGTEFRAEWKDDFQRFRTEFEWSEENMQQVFTMLQDSNMVVTDEVSEPEFKSDTLYIPEGHFEQVAWMPAGMMKAELARQVWGMKQYYPVWNDVFDNTLVRAMEMWGEVRTLVENTRRPADRN